LAYIPDTSGQASFHLHKRDTKEKYQVSKQMLLLFYYTLLHILYDICLFIVLYSKMKRFSLQFNLVCDNSHFRAMADSLFMVGALLGSIIFGDMSDR
jgi:hypothetical protein